MQKSKYQARMHISVSETWKDAINPIYHGGHPSQKTKKYMAPKIKHIMTKSERVDDFNEIAQRHDIQREHGEDLDCVTDRYQDLVRVTRGGRIQQTAM